MEPITVMAMGAAAVYFLGRRKVTPATVSTAKSGRKWLTRIVSASFIQGIKHTVVSVFAPAGAFGQHGEVLVATFKQTGSDKNSRMVIATGPQATPAMITAAGVDFGIKSPAAAA